MRLTVIAMAIFLAGCATSYGRAGLLRPAGGYSDKQVADGWEVRYRSNGYTPPGNAMKGALYRSAELARDAGFPYFQVVRSRGIRHTMSINHGPPSYVGETAILMIRGARSQDDELQCENASGKGCVTLSTETTLHELESVDTRRRSNAPVEQRPETQ